MTLIEKVEQLRDARNHAVILFDQATAKLAAFTENPTEELRQEASLACTYFQNFSRVLRGAALDVQRSL